MFSLRDIIIFLAEAEAFHTLTHLVFSYVVKIPSPSFIDRVNINSQYLGDL